MKRFVRSLSAVLALFLLLSLFSSCSNKPEQEAEAEPPSVPASSTTETLPETLPVQPVAPTTVTYINPLTGLETATDFSVRRPIVVSINNFPASLPQAGIQSASIIYEVLAEGGITRLIGVFPDSKSIPTIGTVRSTRPYIVDIATGYDPIFIHFGGSVDGYARIGENKIMSIDGIAYDGIYFYRDKERVKKAGLEHSAFTNAELLGKALEKIKDLDAAREASKAKPAFEFATEPVVPAAFKASTVKVSFSSYNNKSTFTYNEMKKVYTKKEYGEDHIDGLTKQALEVTNVFALEIPSKAIDSVGRREMDTTGSGKGYYATAGGGCSITWSRKDVHSQFEYKLPDGTPLKVNPGNSYVSIVNSLEDVTFGEN